MASGSSSAGDAGDLERGEGLTMTALAAVVLSAAELEDDDLGAADQRLADLDAFAAAHEEDLAEADGVADVACELFDAELVALRHSILLSARFDDRVAICAICR